MKTILMSKEQLAKRVDELELEKLIGLENKAHNKWFRALSLSEKQEIHEEWENKMKELFEGWE